MARPNLSYLKNLALVVVGAGIGFWSSMTGMGMAVAAGPFLSWLLGIKGNRRSAAVLVSTIGAAAAGLLAYGERDQISIIAGVLFALCGVAGALVGAIVNFAAGRGQNRVVRTVWGVMIVAAGSWLMYYAGSPHRTVHLPAGSQLGVTAVCGLISGLVGTLGNLAGLTGPPLLVVAGRVSPLTAQATALLALIIVSVPPLANYSSRSEVPHPTSTWLLFGAVLGGLAGSQTANMLHDLHRVHGNYLVFCYGITLFVVGMFRLGLARRPEARETPVEPGTPEDS